VRECTGKFKTSRGPTNNLYALNEARAGRGDIDIFRKEGGLKSKMPASKRVIADHGYTTGEQPPL
jgi:hypothetical protein